MRKQARIFVLIDALGWEWVKAARFLEGLAPHRRSLTSVLGYSAGAIPSILTGRLPAEHGRMAMYQRAAVGASPFRRLRWICGLPPALVENRYFRGAFKLAAQRLCGIGGYFELYKIPLRYLPYLDVPEKNCIYQPGGIPGVPSIFDVLRARQIPYRAYWYAKGTDAELFGMLGEELGRGEIPFHFVYLAGVDAFLHEHADDPATVTSFLSFYDSQLRQAYEIARQRYERVGLYVFSDHGMAPTRATLDLQAMLGEIDLDPVKSCLALVDSTMARFWFQQETIRSKVKAVLHDSECGRWLAESELQSLGAWFPDHRYGEEIYLLSEGVVFAPSHMGPTAPKGMHGFHPAARHSLASFVSSDDCIHELDNITDIFRLMERCCAYL